MSCTRLFIGGEVHRRLFCLFDKNLPYEVTLSYKDFTNKKNYRLSYGSPFVYMTRVNKYVNKTIRVETQEDGDKLVADIFNGKNCLTCNLGKECCKIIPVLYYKNQTNSNSTNM